MSDVAIIDGLRVINSLSIPAAYAPVGSVFAHLVRIICFTNNTNGDVIVSFDGVTDNVIMPATSFKLFDLNTNRSGINSSWTFPVGTQVYAKQSSIATAPTTGDFYVECIYQRGE